MRGFFTGFAAAIAVILILSFIGLLMYPDLIIIYHNIIKLLPVDRISVQFQYIVVVNFLIGTFYSCAVYGYTMFLCRFLCVATRHKSGI